MAGKERLSPLKQARIERGLTQSELAREAGISRQALGAIEAGLYQPTVGVALRLSKALGVSVESLFAESSGDEFAHVTATLFDPDAKDLRSTSHNQQLSLYLARVGNRVVAATQPKARLRLELPAGVIKNGSESGEVDVVAFWSREDINTTVFVSGCDPASSILDEYLSRTSGRFRAVCLERSSVASLEALRDKFVHVAGVHLRNSSGFAGASRRQEHLDFNVEIVRNTLRSEPFLIVHFARWELGLAFQRGNPRGIKGPEDLLRSDLRVALREPGSGAYQAVYEALARSGIWQTNWPSQILPVCGHLEAAAAVAERRADVAATVRIAAEAFGLGFLPLREECYDLVILKRFLEDAPLRAVMDMLNSSRFARQVSAMCGYDTVGMGAIVEEI